MPNPSDIKYIISFGDSGAGGLIFALDAYEAILPKLLALERKYQVEFEIHHLGDSKNAPYGSKPVKEIRQLTENFVSYLSKKSEITVVACNTASTVVDEKMLEKFSEARVIPIIKRSAEALYKRGKIIHGKGGHRELHLAIMATPATINSEQYQQALIDIHALKHPKGDVKLVILTLAPENWTKNIELGIDKKLAEEQVKKDLEEFFKNKDKRISAIGLFCTHYPFYKKLISHIFKDHKMHVSLLSQGKVFAKDIQALIDTDIATGKLEKRPRSLTRNLENPVVISEITGENIEQIQKVAKIVKPKFAKKIMFCNLSFPT